MDHVPKDQWCTCEPRVKFRGTEYPPSPPLEIPGLSWLSGLFGGGGQKADAKKDGAGKEEL